MRRCPCCQIASFCYLSYSRTQRSLPPCSCFGLPFCHLVLLVLAPRAVMPTVIAAVCQQRQDIGNITTLLPQRARPHAAPKSLRCTSRRYRRGPHPPTGLPRRLAAPLPALRYLHRPASPVPTGSCLRATPRSSPPQPWHLQVTPAELDSVGHPRTIARHGRSLNHRGC